MTLFCAPAANSNIANEVKDEKFEEVLSLIDGVARLLDDGKMFETAQIMSYQCALGRNSYSAGVHRIHLKIHRGNACIGIRSRRIRLEPDLFLEGGQYQKTPSTYAWVTDSQRVVNGRHSGFGMEPSSREEATVELTINCDERRLTIVIIKETSGQDEMEVDRLHAPFPWCLFVQLNRIGGCISLS